MIQYIHVVLISIVLQIMPMFDYRKLTSTIFILIYFYNKPFLVDYKKVPNNQILDAFLFIYD